MGLPGGGGGPEPPLAQVLVDPAKTAAHHLERILSERGLKAEHPAAPPR